jgi:hypothetical protein
VRLLLVHLIAPCILVWTRIGWVFDLPSRMEAVIGARVTVGAVVLAALIPVIFELVGFWAPVSILRDLALIACLSVIITADVVFALTIAQGWVAA